jgi:hypothetical protein
VRRGGAAGLILATGMTVILGGCAGTFDTRVASDADVVGSYPFQAVVVDVQTIADPVDKHVPSAFIVVIAVLSIPLDLTIDAALSPVDLILWPFGFAKGRRSSPHGGP